MKRMALGIVFATLATQGIADGMTDPIIEAPIVAQAAAEAAGPDPMLVVLLMTAIVFGAAASSN